MKSADIDVKADGDDGPSMSGDGQVKITVQWPQPEIRPSLATIINLDDFEESFKRFGETGANAYISSASNDLLTHRANAKCWQKISFRPRVMHNVAEVNTRVKILGCDVSMPLWICPMGIAMTAGPEGEAALGQGAARCEIIHCASITSSIPIDDILASAPTNPWFFQLYVNQKREKSEAVIKKISNMSQIKAIFVTADLPIVSKREADERFKVSKLQPGKSPKSGIRREGLASSTGSFIDPALAWDDLAWIRKHTDLPIVVKGIQGASDAVKAMNLGCAGIVVSNHGGRALDGAPATIAILLELRRDCPEVFDRMEVLVDGGVRRGSDILKAICIGARGVGIGRPFQCSVAYGTDGVVHCAESKSFRHQAQRCAKQTKWCEMS